MIYTCNPAKISIYITTGKSAAQVKQETGADAVINGGAFDGNCPVAHLKVNGKVLADENWGTPNNYGYGFTSNQLVMTDDMSVYPNFISCVCMIKDGKLVPGFQYPPDMGYARQRTAIGVLRDGSVWMMADTAVPRTPEQLRAYALEQGCVSAVMLDGGTSTQCAFPGGTLYGGRTAANYICVWAKKDKEDKPVDKKIKVYLSPSSQPANIYAAGNTNEQVSCRRIAAHCQNALERCGFDCIIGAAEIDFTGRVQDSNRWGADYHIPIHTNAGGGHGVVCFVYKDKSLAQPVYDAINAIAPYKSTYGVRVDKSLYEVKNTTAKCIYVEAAFHDNEAEAAWIVSHQQEIGEAIAKGICQTAGVEYILPKEEKEKTLTERIEALEAWARTKGY